MARKGIILAGGSGTRLHPLTQCLSKQLLPVYDKPMIYYPIATLMSAGIREILIISTPRDLPLFQQLLGDGAQWGLHFSYKEQLRPEGLAQAFLIGEFFIGQDPVTLILGDNIFYGHKLDENLNHLSSLTSGAGICAYYVRDPERYGVINMDKNGKVLDIEEKPTHPKSHYAAAGLYFYDNRVVEYAKLLKPSKRGELEITDLNNIYLRQNALHVEILDRGIAWLDAGTHESLLAAGNFIEVLERRQGLKIACLEEVAYRMGFISREQLIEQAERLKSSDYGRYLIELISYESNKVQNSRSHRD